MIEDEDLEAVEREGEKLENDLHKARRTDKRQKWGLFVLSMLLMIACAVIWLLLVNAWNRADHSEGVARTEQTEKKEIAQEAQRALCGTKDKEIYDKDLCEKWADAAQEPVTSPSEPPVVIGGPSQAELVAAFRAYCAEGNCKGKDGAPPTADDIAAAFVKFCSDGRCTGPAGKDAPPAKDGKDGADGESLPPSPEMVLAAVTTYCGASGACVGPAGPSGPPPTAEAVLAAVQQVCANDACRGPAGADSTVPGPVGATGEQGPQGVSIVDVDCVGEGADSTWQITLSDGQILNGGGPCKTTIGGPPLIPGVTP